MATKTTKAATKKKSSTTTKKATPKKATTKAAKVPKEDLVVFAIRLTAAERDAIHAAAGPRGATRFVRGLAVAAARDDLKGIQAVLKEARQLRG